MESNNVSNITKMLSYLDDFSKTKSEQERISFIITYYLHFVNGDLLGEKLLNEYKEHYPVSTFFKKYKGVFNTVVNKYNELIKEQSFLCALGNNKIIIEDYFKGIQEIIDNRSV